MKKMKEAERQKTKNEELENASKNAVGETVPFVTTVNSGCEISEVYLKHPGNESSEDEDGTEDRNRRNEEDEEKEEESFTDFLKRRNLERSKRESKRQSDPNTSKH